MNDESRLQDYAESEGLTLEQAKKMRDLQTYKRTQEEAQNRQNADATYENWMRQAEELQEIYPDFDIQEETSNPEFIKILRNGFTVQQAYELAHPEVQTDRIRREVTSKIASNMQSRQRRPPENGAASTVGIERRTNVENFTPEDRKKAIEQSRKNGSGSVRFS